MLKTSPIPLSYLTDSEQFVYGFRVQELLGLQFPASELSKRILRKSQDGKNGEAAFYIDIRDVALRLNRVVGPSNWDLPAPIVTDAGDRVVVTYSLKIGKVLRSSEAEALKLTDKKKYKGKDDQGRNTYETVKDSDDLVVLSAGPQAFKRAAALHGIGTYLYKFKEVNTWESLNDRGFFVNPDVDITKLPSWAIPLPGPRLVVRELAHLFGIEVPEGSIPKEVSDELSKNLDHFWGIKSLKDAKLTDDEYLRLAACIARISDFVDVNKLDPISFLDSKINLRAA